MKAGKERALTIANCKLQIANFKFQIAELLHKSAPAVIA